MGLDVLTDLGYVDDPRLSFALDHLRRKRRRDGRWNLEAAHPDVEGPMAAWYASHPTRRPHPLTFDTVDGASKMITLRALTVLRRMGEY